ncbi:Type II secretory pathway, component PulF [Candidatus Magnetomoraceae bacterium gMMP-15]
MPVFSYKAVNNRNENVSGTIEAESVQMASNMLVDQGFYPSSVRKTAEVFGGASFTIKERLTTVKIDDLLLFTKQFRTMLNVNLTVDKILKVLEKHTQNIKLKKIITMVARDVSTGSKTSEAFRKYPKVFNELYCTMVNAGEESDSLLKVFDRLVDLIDHEHKLKTDISIALQYPIFVLCALFIAFFVILSFVIPKYITIFAKHNIELPLPTQVCNIIYNFSNNNWEIGLITIFGICLGLFFYLKTETGKYNRDAILLKIPIVGPVFAKANISRFANIFELLKGSGKNDIRDIMNILSGTIGNRVISRDFEKVKKRIEEGRFEPGTPIISGALKSSKQFPPMVRNMISIGEESNRLETMLSEISTHYDDEVEYAIKRMKEAIGPILTIGLAIVIGFFASAIFIPMADLTKILR